MLRFGTYTRFKGFDFKLVKEKDHFKLIFNGANCPLPNFVKYIDSVYYLSIPLEEIDNAFFVKTKCIYKGYKFDVSMLLDNKIIGIVTDSKEAFEKLNLEFRDRGVYQKEIKLTEMEKLWEERASSSYNLPMPEGLELAKEIKIPKDI